MELGHPSRSEAVQQPGALTPYLWSSSCAFYLAGPWQLAQVLTEVANMVRPARPLRIPETHPRCPAVPSQQLPPHHHVAPDGHSPFRPT